MLAAMTKLSLDTHLTIPGNDVPHDCSIFFSSALLEPFDVLRAFIPSRYTYEDIFHSFPPASAF